MFQGFRKIYIYIYFSWRITHHGISALKTPADSMITKQDILEVARKWAQKKANPVIK